VKIWDNPIVRREGVPRWWRRLRRQRPTLAAALAATIVAAPVFVGVFAASLGNFILFALYPLWWSILCPVMAAALLARAITDERERRTWDLLLLTRLTPWEIIWGKLVSRWVGLAAFSAAVVSFLGASLAAQHTPAPSPLLEVLSWWAWATTALTGLLMAGGASAIALYASLRSSSSSEAAGVTAAAVLLLLVVGWLAPRLLWLLLPAGSIQVSMMTLPRIVPALLCGLVLPPVLLSRMVQRFRQIDARARA
jgi:ABC-type transport system involved in multi-copper enzyme maturation permease subunit